MYKQIINTNYYIIFPSLISMIMRHYFFQLTHSREQGRNTKQKSSFLVQMKTLKFALQNKNKSGTEDQKKEQTCKKYTLDMKLKDENKKN